MEQNATLPFPAESTDSNAQETTSAFTEVSGNQGYCLPPTTADSLACNHGLYQPFGPSQHHTVLATLFGHFDKKTGTLQISAVPFYPHVESTNDALGWDKSENRSAAVNAINNVFQTLHNNGSLPIRLATQGATRIKTRLKGGNTVGGGIMQFLNSMILEYGVDTFKLDGDMATVCTVSFRVGTCKCPDAPSGTNDTTNPVHGRWIAPRSKNRNLSLQSADLLSVRELISRGTQIVKIPKKVPNCYIGSVPFWTTGQAAK